ncbi:MAG: acetyl-CoA carboxylase biotin carboxyl carrier protein [Ruminococcus sp.]|nr:acetyl-CoA carboxylase biotin carboxyl carrier protein [Ruminococcus sp.]
MIDINTLKEYIKVLEESSLTCIEISDEDDTIRLERELYEAPSNVTVQPVQAPAAPVAPAAEAPAAPSVSTKAIKSPMVGVFYAAPAPEKPAFVSVGQTVNKGDVVCIIEAMKIMNEITAEESGTITEVLVNNGDVVEFDQPLFTIS